MNEYCTIAYCRNCGNAWRVTTLQPVATLEGACMECQQDSDAEKPLKFARAYSASVNPFLPELPAGWLVLS